MTRFLFFCATLWGSSEFITFPSDIDWVSRESPHFITLYRRGHDELSERALMGAERAYQKLSPFFPEKPEKTWVVLADFNDDLNGYAMAAPYPHMVIFVSPPDPGGYLAPLEDWLDSVILHEYVHVLHLYPTKGLWTPLRAVFGSWVMPNALLPKHFHEGLAVFLETELSQGGRGRSALFKMIRRQAVAAKAWGKEFVPLDLLDGSGTRFPFGMSAYFFGYQWYERLWKAKGTQGIYRLMEASAENWPYFLDVPYEEVYGQDIDRLWEKVYADGEKAAQKELAAIDSKAVPSLEYHSKDQGSKSDVVHSPDGKRIAYRSAGFDRKPKIVTYHPESKKEEWSLEVERGSSDGLCWGKGEKFEGLVFSESANNREYQYAELRYAEIGSKKKEPLTFNSEPLRHVMALSCSNDLSTLITYEESGGAGFLRQYSSQFPEKFELRKSREWRVPVGQWVSGIALNAGKTYFWLRQNLVSHLLKWGSGDDPENILSLKGNVFSPRISGGRIEVIWDKDERYEIWSIDPEKKLAEKKVALQGGAISFDRLGPKLFLSSYEHGGWDIAETSGSAKTQNIAVSEKISVPPKEPLSVSLSAPHEYSPLSTLRPRLWIPFIFVVPDGLQTSIWIPGFDIGQKHNYALVAGYDTRSGGAGFATGYHQYRFGKTSALNSSVFYQPSYIDASTGLLTQWGGGVSISSKLFGGEPLFSLGLSFRRLQKTALTTADLDSVGPNFGFSYSFGRDQLPLAALPRLGTTFSLTASPYPRFLGSTQDYVVGTASIVQYLPVPWSSRHGFFTRLSLGFTDGTAWQNSYFLGGGELLFSFGQGTYLNRGFPALSFLARRIASLTAEYHLVLGRPERGIGLFPAFLKSTRLALVGDFSTFDLGVGPPPARVQNARDIFRLYYASVGAEFKANFNMGFYLPMAFRFGFYHGFGQDLRFVFALEGSFL